MKITRNMKHITEKKRKVTMLEYSGSRQRWNVQVV